MNNVDVKQNIRVFIAKFPFKVNSDYLPLPRRKEIDSCGDEGVRRSKYYSFKLLERALATVYSVSLKDVDFKKNASGKWTCDVCELSVSHSNDIVAVAVSDKPVGIDVELIDCSRFDERLQRRILSASEQETAISLTAEERARYANKLWTVKEALFKRDEGTAFAAASIDTLLGDYETVTVLDGDKKYYLSIAGQPNAVVEYHAQGVAVEKTNIP